MLDPDPSRNLCDARLAGRLVEALEAVAWSAGCRRLGDGRWSARVASSSATVDVEAVGTSRVSALSAAHVEAVRRLSVGARPGDVPSP